jgi:hypothetical protein
MTALFRSGCVAATLFTLLFSGVLQAQVQVHLKMLKPDYVAHEQVLATVTITNRAGRDLYLHNESRMNWLDFDIKNQRGVPLSPLRGGLSFKAARIGAGQSVSKTIDLNALYRVSDLGRYRLSAVVRLPGGEGTLFSSNNQGFNVTKARSLYRQRVGVAGDKNVREFSVLTFSTGQKSVLYVQVEDVATGRMLQTFPLGEVLMFRQPTATVDGQNNLHILYLVSPTTFARSRVNSEGKFLGQDFYQRGVTGAPRLVTFGNGEVQVAGGVPFDPKAQKAAAQKIRRISERPAVAY